jgi:aryl-alcohol dehydrogenase-like predicted oxidoreductase
MKYRMLGDTGLSVSEIGFGTWGLGGTAYGYADDQESKKALEASFDKGINFYDTADLYGDGHSEELLGEVFAGRRDKVIITTKGGTLPHTTFDMPQDFSSGHIKKALEKSLKRLRTDYIDLYLLHSPNISDIQESTNLVQTLETLKAEGKIRSYGISARTPEDAMVAINDFGFRVIEVNFNLIDHRIIEAGLFDRAKVDPLGIIVRTPLTFGYLTGTLKGDENFQGIDHRTNWPKDQLKRWAAAPQLYSFLFEGKSRTPAQAALRFCLDFDEVSTVIPGMMKVGEVLENSAVSEMAPLSVEQMTQIQEIYNSNDFYDKTAKTVRS